MWMMAGGLFNPVLAMVDLVELGMAELVVMVMKKSYEGLTLHPFSSLDLISLVYRFRSNYWYIGQFMYILFIQEII